MAQLILRPYYMPLQLPIGLPMTVPCRGQDANNLPLRTRSSNCFICLVLLLYNGEGLHTQPSARLWHALVMVSWHRRATAPSVPPYTQLFLWLQYLYPFDHYRSVIDFHVRRCSSLIGGHRAIDRGGASCFPSSSTVGAVSRVAPAFFPAIWCRFKVASSCSPKSGSTSLSKM